MWEAITYDSSKSITLIATSLLSSLSNLQIRKVISTVCKSSSDYDDKTSLMSLNKTKFHKMFNLYMR